VSRLHYTAFVFFVWLKCLVSINRTTSLCGIHRKLTKGIERKRSVERCSLDGKIILKGTENVYWNQERVA
jgi:hypothetical protein